jgi:Ni/Co efflux regulator RcnB
MQRQWLCTINILKSSNYMGNPSSTGMGQGAAQVFDTRGVLNTFVRVSMMEQQQRQLDEQNLAKMMTQFDPSKLRANDLPAFNDKVTRLQNLYTQNKGLYKNPMKYPDKYREAQQLTSELRSLAVNSKELETTLLEGAKMRNSGKRPMAKNTVGNIQRWSGMSTEDIIRENSGKLPSMMDFEYIPEELNDKEVKDLVRGVAGSAGVLRNNTTLVPNPNDMWQLDKTEIESVDEDAFGKIANFALNNNDIRDHYAYKASEVPVEQMNQMRLDATKKFPGININDPAAIYAAFDLADRYRVLDKKSSTVNNEGADRAQRAKERAQDHQWSLDREWRQDARADKRTAATIGAIYESQYAKDFNKEHAGELQSKLYHSKDYPVSDEELNGLLAPFVPLTAYSGSPVVAFRPEQYKDKDSFVRAVKAKVSDAEPFSETFSMTDYEIGRAYETKRPVPAFVMTDKDGKNSSVVLNVSKPGFKENLAKFMQDAELGSKTTGFGLGSKGYTQKELAPKKKVKK